MMVLDIDAGTFVFSRGVVEGVTGGGVHFYASSGIAFVPSMGCFPSFFPLYGDGDGGVVAVAASA